MLTTYIQSAMKHAKYEILDDQTFYGAIVGFQGVYARYHRKVPRGIAICA